MNIVYIHSHDTGRYIEPYGYAVPTPNLMRLAREGLLFRHAFSVAPTCSPSRSGLLTGRMPHSNGMIGLAGIGQLHDCSQHMAHYLRSQGYVTALSGQQHEIDSQSWGQLNHVGKLGYERNLNERNEIAHRPLNHIQGDLGWFRDMDRRAAELAAEFIQERRSSDDSRPFFLSAGFFFPHRNYVPADPDINPNYVMPPFPLYDTPDTRSDWAMHLSAVRSMDDGVGVILQALQQSGLADNTIVMYTTDHGVAIPRMKSSLFDTGIGVSLLLKVPGMAGGRVSDALVSQLDLFPTLCELAGIAKPVWLEGVSMKPLLDGEEREIRRHLFAEMTYHCAYEPLRCIRTSRYKLIRRYHGYPHPVLPNIDDSPSKHFLLEHGYRHVRQEREMLYDLYLDPVERENRIDDAAYRNIYTELATELDAWMRRTDDPLLKGNVPKPEGYKVRPVTSLSPQSDEHE